MEYQVQHLVCYCNTTWSSILPPPPCPYHSVPACGHGHWQWIPHYTPSTTWYPGYYHYPNGTITVTNTTNTTGS